MFKLRRCTTMLNLNYEVYEKIVGEVISPQLNSLEAKNKLSKILEQYEVHKLVNDPKKYDLKHNIKEFLKDKERQGVSPLTIDGYGRQLGIFADTITKKVQDI